jgi:Mrp family chromosome partitioning ATPase
MSMALVRPRAPSQAAPEGHRMALHLALRFVFKHGWLLLGMTAAVTAGLLLDRSALDGLGLPVPPFAAPWPLALLSGVAVGVVVAGLRELADRRLQQPGQAERYLGEPVLAALPALAIEQVPGDTFATPLAVRRAREAAAGRPPPQSADSAPALLAPARAVWARDAQARDQRVHGLAQYVRELLGVHGLHDAATTGDARVLLVTSARPGEGKSCVARALAKRLTLQQGGRVLLIDAGMAGQAGAQDVPPARCGFFDLLQDPEAPVRVRPSRHLPRLHVLPAGVPPADGIDPDPAALTTLFARTRARYAWTIIDAGVLPVAAPLASLSDGVLLVVDAMHTPREAVRAGLAAAELPEERLLGVVLNRQPAYVPRSLLRYWS